MCDEASYWCSTIGSYLYGTDGVEFVDDWSEDCVYGSRDDVGWASFGLLSEYGDLSIDCAG